MIVVLQRVGRAAVEVGGEVVASIGRGVCLLACAVQGDEADDARWLGSKIAGLRVFPDEAGLTNRSLSEVDGAALIVPQFTLAADWRKGRRPSFTRAAQPEQATSLLECLAEPLREAGVDVAMGRFGAEMHVDLLNHGPFTLVLDSAVRPGSGAADSP
ncbi:MAG: D-aminoacyl-tRNA deacylase [Planctomycetota bacterium]